MARTHASEEPWNVSVPTFMDNVLWVGIQEDNYGQTLHLEIIGVLQVPMRIVSKI